MRPVHLPVRRRHHRRFAGSSSASPAPPALAGLWIGWLGIGIPPNGAAAARSAAALLERDQRLEKLLSERTALKFQLEAESGRRAALEKQLATIGASVGGAAAAAGGGATRIDIAVEHAPLMSGRSRGGEGSVPSRQLTRLLQTNVRNPRPQLVQAANAADDLLDLLDRTALTAGAGGLSRGHRALHGTARHVWAP